MKLQVQKAIDMNLTRNENTEKYISSNAAMIQVYSDKKAAILKANATVAIQAQIVLLHCTMDFPRFLIDRGHTILILLLVLASESAVEQEMMTQLKIMMENMERISYHLHMPSSNCKKI